MTRSLARTSSLGIRLHYYSLARTHRPEGVGRVLVPAEGLVDQTGVVEVPEQVERREARLLRLHLQDGADGMGGWVGGWMGVGVGGWGRAWVDGRV